MASKNSAFSEGRGSAPKSPEELPEPTVIDTTEQYRVTQPVFKPVLDDEDNPVLDEEGKPKTKFTGFEEPTPLPEYGELTAPIDSKMGKDAKFIPGRNANFFLWGGNPVLPHPTKDENGNSIELTEAQENENKKTLQDFADVKQLRNNQIVNRYKAPEPPKVEGTPQRFIKPTAISTGSELEKVTNDLLNEQNPNNDTAEPTAGEKPNFKVYGDAPEGVTDKVWNKLVEHHKDIKKKLNDAEYARGIVGAEGSAEQHEKEAEYLKVGAPIQGLRGAFRSPEHFDEVMERARTVGERMADEASKAEADRGGETSFVVKPKPGKVYTHKELLDKADAAAKRAADKKERDRARDMETIRKQTPELMAAYDEATTTVAQKKMSDDDRKREARLATFRAQDARRAQAEQEAPMRAALVTGGGLENKLKDLPQDHPVFDELADHFKKVDDSGVPSELPASVAGSVRGIVESKMKERESLATTGMTVGEVSKAEETEAKKAERMASLKSNLAPIDPASTDPMKHAYYKTPGVGAIDLHTGTTIPNEVAIVNPHLELSVKEAAEVNSARADASTAVPYMMPSMKAAPEDIAEKPAEEAANVTKKPSSRASGVATDIPSAESTALKGDRDYASIMPKNRDIVLKHPDTGADITVHIGDNGVPEPTGNDDLDSAHIRAFAPWAADRLGEATRAQKAGSFEAGFNSLRVNKRTPKDALENPDQPIEGSNPIDELAGRITRNKGIAETAPGLLRKHLEKTHAAMTEHLKDLQDRALQTGDATTRFSTGTVTANTSSGSLEGETALAQPGSAVGQHITAFQSKLAEARTHLDMAREIHEGSSAGPGTSGLNPNEANPHILAAALALGAAHDHVSAPAFDATPISRRVDVDNLVDVARHASANVRGMSSFHKAGDLPSTAKIGGKTFTNVPGLLASARLAEHPDNVLTHVPVEVDGVVRGVAVEDMPSSKELESSLGNLGTGRLPKTQRQSLAGAQVVQQAGGDVLNGVGVSRTPATLTPGFHKTEHPDEEKARAGEPFGITVNDSGELKLPHRESDINGKPRNLTPAQQAENGLHKAAFQKLVNPPLNPLQWGMGQGSMVNRRVRFTGAASTIDASGGKGTREGSRPPTGVDLSGSTPSRAEVSLSEAARTAHSMGMHKHGDLLANPPAEDVEAGEVRVGSGVHTALRQVAAARLAHLVTTGVDPSVTDTARSAPAPLLPGVKGTTKSHVTAAIKDPEGYTAKSLDAMKESAKPLVNKIAEEKSASESTAASERAAEITRQGKVASDIREKQQSNRRNYLAGLMEKGQQQARLAMPAEGAAGV